MIERVFGGMRALVSRSLVQHSVDMNQFIAIRCVLK
jgi:hypothetical protein